MKSSEPKTCPRCQQRFECGVSCGRESCWCFDLPRIVPVVENAECLCPACLQDEIRAQSAPETQEPPSSEDGSPS